MCGLFEVGLQVSCYRYIRVNGQKFGLPGVFPWLWLFHVASVDHFTLFLAKPELLMKPAVFLSCAFGLWDINEICDENTETVFVNATFVLLDEPSGQHIKKEIWCEEDSSKINEICRVAEAPSADPGSQKYSCTDEQKFCSLELVICLTSQCPRATSLQGTTQEVHYKKYQGRQDCFVQDSRSPAMGPAAKCKKEEASVQLFWCW
jgi:hypothetical protein